MKQSMAALTSQETSERYTPRWCIDLVRDVVAGIALDPASTPAANEMVMANRILTMEEDGLSLPWRARTVFVNWPYTGNGSPKWSKAIIQKYSSREFEAGIALCFAKLGYNWFNDLLRDYPTCLVYDRIAFLEPDTLQPKVDKSGNPVAAKHGSAFVYFGEDYRMFQQVFSSIGKVVLPWRS